MNYFRRISADYFNPPGGNLLGGKTPNPSAAASARLDITNFPSGPLKEDSNMNQQEKKAEPPLSQDKNRT